MSPGRGLARISTPGLGALQAGEPGALGRLELPVLVLLGVLAQEPDVAVVVLRLEGELGLLQLALVDVAVPEDDGGHAVDDLGEVGHGEHHAMGEDALAAVGASLKDVPGPRDERVPLVVDGGHGGEVPAVEVGLGDVLGRLGRRGRRHRLDRGVAAGLGAARGHHQRQRRGHRRQPDAPDHHAPLSVRWWARGSADRQSLASRAWRTAGTARARRTGSAGSR